MKKQEAPERILGRKLARELRGEELARANGSVGSNPNLPLQPIATTSMSQPPDTMDGWAA